MGHGLRLQPGALGLALVDDEAAADGVAGRLGAHVARAVERAEAHAVGVARQDFGEVEDEVAGGVERYCGAPARQVEGTALGQSLRILTDPIRIDGRRIVAEQSQKNRRVGAVAAPGPGERSEDLGADPGGLGLSCDPLAEPASGDHRADGVRARRADADLEQVEDADHPSPIPMPASCRKPCTYVAKERQHSTR